MTRRVLFFFGGGPSRKSADLSWNQYGRDEIFQESCLIVDLPGNFFMFFHLHGTLPPWTLHVLHCLTRPPCNCRWPRVTSAETVMDHLWLQLKWLDLMKARKESRSLPCLKLTASLHLKMDSWKTFSFPFWVPAYFQGRLLVSFRECIRSMIYVTLLKRRFWRDPFLTVYVWRETYGDVFLENTPELEMIGKNMFQWF